MTAHNKSLTKINNFQTAFTHILGTHPSSPRFRVILFGTPAEETTGGKIDMINAGAFKDVHCVLMAHPGGRDAWRAQWLALETLEVEFFGKTSHAGGAPWEGERNFWDPLPPGCMYIKSNECEQESMPLMLLLWLTIPSRP